MRKKAIVRHVAKKVPTQGRQRGETTETGLPVAGKSGSNGTRTRWAADFLEGVEEDQSDEEIFYRSSNGDLRYLTREPDSDRLKVCHQPNRASGGQSTIVEVSKFLSSGRGPQHEALLRLLATSHDR